MARSCKDLEKSGGEAERGLRQERDQLVETVREMRAQTDLLIRQTEAEGERQKIEQLRMFEQNRSLMLILAEKEREIGEKNRAIKLF